MSTNPSNSLSVEQLSDQSANASTTSNTGSDIGSNVSDEKKDLRDIVFDHLDKIRAGDKSVDWYTEIDCDLDECVLEHVIKYRHMDNKKILYETLRRTLNKYRVSQILHCIGHLNGTTDACQSTCRGIIELIKRSEI